MNKFKSEVAVTIDEDYDLGYIYFKSPWGSSEKQRPVKGDCNIILDFDAEGHIIGIETLRASEHIHPIMRAPGKTLSEVVAELRAAAERERCALIAETMACPITYGDYQNGWDHATTEIAAAIRKGE